MILRSIKSLVERLLQDNQTRLLQDYLSIKTATGLLQDYQTLFHQTF